MSAENSTELLKSRRGEVLRNARNQAGLSARKLADRINQQTAGSDLTENAIYAYESGRVLLSRESAERIAQVLRLPLGELLVGDPDFAPVAAAPNTDESEYAWDYDRPATSQPVITDRRFHRACADLLDPGRQVRATADVLRRLLAGQRYVLKSPAGLAKVFELLAGDVQSLLSHPAAVHVQLQNPTQPYDQPQAFLQAVEALASTADRGYAKLETQARDRGNCAPGCRKIADRLDAQIAMLDDELGSLRRHAQRPA